MSVLNADVSGDVETAARSGFSEATSARASIHSATSTSSSRTAEESQTGRLSDYTKATGRSFNTYMDQLMWPQTERVRHLKKRSASINITLEDITRITDTFDTIYSIDADLGAVPPPADRSLIGR